MKTYHVTLFGAGTINGSMIDTHEVKGISSRWENGVFVVLGYDGPVGYFCGVSHVKVENGPDDGTTLLDAAPESWKTPVADLPTGRAEVFVNQEAVVAGCLCTTCSKARETQTIAGDLRDE